MSFKISRGTNNYHWRMREDGKPPLLDSAEAAKLASIGFDHVRIPFNEEHLWDRMGRAHRDSLRHLRKAIDSCLDAGLDVILDLHTAYSHHFIAAVTPRLFTDPAEEMRFALVWSRLSSYFKDYPVGRVAYELLNEAVAADPADWNRVASAAHSAIRDAEPERTVVLGSNYFNQTHTFHSLDIPDDPNIILTFHYYRPMLITHHQATWWEGGFYAGPINYPGAPLAPEDLKGLCGEFCAKVPQWSNEPYGPEEFQRDLQEPLAVARKRGLPLYCGEFGCIMKAPQPIRRAWLSGFMGVLKSNGVSWANWDCRSDNFGLFDMRGNETGILDILME